MRGLDGKVGIVAGAAPGNIGAATAKRLAEEGMSVVVADLNEAAAQAVAAEITATGAHAVAQRLDIADEESYADLITFTVERFGGLDGLRGIQE